MLVFDRRSLRCVVPPTEDCDIPTTPQPFDGDLEQGKGNAISNLPPGAIQGKLGGGSGGGGRKQN
ncbi:hypothetical protein pipiens_020287, partial [Culex pipiens pipiens]